ncbi:glycosyltransferase [Salinimonas marina]|uniref:Glycosyltransferase n=2 Tax=Salinimonas marina TaxID=2785918 RepID=A0A7S9HBZ0_9ALTE|nr:glycosyltransferase [Salinimonas marina]
MVTSPIVDLTEPFAGGTEAFVVRLANGLAARGHEVDVLCRKADETNRFNTLAIEESALRMCDAITSETEGQKQYQAAQYGLIDTSGYDVVHYHSYYHAIYDYGFLHRRRSVITLHSPVSERLALTHKLNRARTNDVYVTVSERLRDEWSEVLGDGLYTIPNGIEPAHYQADSVPALPESGFLLSSGRICHDKNTAAAIELAETANMPLIIAGPIADETYYATHIRPYLSDTIRYAGHLSQTELKRYLSAATALLCTSAWREPFGLSTLEALACDTPVIGFASAIVPELRQEPVSQIIEASQPEAIVPAISRAARLPAGRCRDFAHQFDFSLTLEKYEQLYANFH